MQSFKPKLGWQDSMAWGLFLIVIYLLLAVSPLFFAWVDSPASDEPLLVEIALAAAMLGFSLVCLQVVLAGRFKTVDRPFGLDVLMQFHKGMAVVAGCLLLSHPVLLAIGHGGWHLFTFETSWQVNWGKAALFLVVVGVLFSMFFSKLGVDYNLWRFGHKGMIFIVILGFIHGFYIGPDVQGGLTRLWWTAAAAIALLIFVYRNVLVPAWLRRGFKVVDVKPETHDTYTLTFEPDDGQPTGRNPGQFMFLKLIRPGRSSELHPFTISASPLNPKQLQATIKQSGNFTT